MIFYGRQEKSRLSSVNFFLVNSAINPIIEKIPVSDYVKERISASYLEFDSILKCGNEISVYGRVKLTKSTNSDVIFKIKEPYIPKIIQGFPVFNTLDGYIPYGLLTLITNSEDVRLFNKTINVESYATFSYRYFF